MVLTSFAEVVSIGAIFPFLGALTNPEKIFDTSFVRTFSGWFDINKPPELLLPLTLLFCVASIVASLMRLILLWSTTKLSFATGADLSNDIYRRTLYQPYIVHIQRNSSEIISAISGKTNAVIYSAISPMITMTTSMIMLISIMGALVIIQPYIALSVFIGFGLIYGIIIKTAKNQLRENSKRTSQEATVVIKSLQEGLGGIRDIIIDGTQEFFCNIYRTSDMRLRVAQGNSQIIGDSPRLIVEALGIVFIAVIAYLMVKRSGDFSMVDGAIPVLGVLALGAQRMLPVMQQLYNSITNIRANESNLKDVIALLNQPINTYAETKEVSALPFNNYIELNNVSYQFPSADKRVLNQITLTIKKGDKVGFIGTTGSGKSTLMDLIMGLISPSLGEVNVDNKPIDLNNIKKWQKNIAHVPQTIYLADNTVAENIAFGLPKAEIKYDRVREVARQAKISDFIETLPGGYETLFGERGVRLSGGQKQRIGIARALYNDSNLLIFDEATNALDHKTEEELFSTIFKMKHKKTIIFITHKELSLKNFDKIYEIENAELKIKKDI